jgi:hypothetical protein
MFDIQLILHSTQVLICTIQQQMVYKYRSVIIELSIKMDPFFTFISNIII